MKISKSLIITIAVGVLIIGGISLGMALNQQTAQKENIEKRLTAAKQKLATLDNEKLVTQKVQLAEQLNEYAAQTAGLKTRLTFSLDNIGITNSLIKGAADCEVDLLEISSPGLATESPGGIKYETMNMSVRARGIPRTTSDFVYSLKKIFPTSVIKSVTLEIIKPENTPTPVSSSIQDNATGAGATRNSVTSPGSSQEIKDTVVNINFTIYSYKNE